MFINPIETNILTLFPFQSRIYLLHRLLAIQSVYLFNQQINAESFHSSSFI